MRLLTIFSYTLLRNLRDVGSMLQMVLLPVVLILILGLALNSEFQPRRLEHIPVGCLNEDRGPAGEYFDRFIYSEEIRALLDTRPVESPESARQKLQEGEIAAFIHLQEGFSSTFSGSLFSDSLPSTEKPALRVTVTPGYRLRSAVVENVLGSFIHGANTVAALRRMGLTEIAYSYQGGAIEDRPLAASGIMPGAIDYYAVTMLVMIIMYGSLYACFGMKESYLDAVGKRIKGSPIRGAEHYVGLVLANVVTVFLQALVVIAFTRHAYGVNWGENLPLLLLITFILVLLSIGLGTMMAMVTRNEMLAGGILNGLIPVFTFLAGGYYRFSVPGKFFSALQHLSPNYLAQTAIFNTIYGGAAAHTGMLLGAMGAIILGTFAVAMASERRKFN